MSKSTELATSLKQETMLQALKISYGAVSKAATMTQITPQTHYNWYKNDEEYRDRVDTPLSTNYMKNTKSWCWRQFLKK